MLFYKQTSERYKTKENEDIKENWTKIFRRTTRLKINEEVIQEIQKYIYDFNTKVRIIYLDESVSAEINIEQTI